MSQTALVAVPQSLGQRLQAQQTAIKTEAAVALGSFHAQLMALAAEANELSKVDNVFDATVRAQLDKFVTFAGGTLPILAKGIPANPPQTQARAA